MKTSSYIFTIIIFLSGIVLLFTISVKGQEKKPDYTSEIPQYEFPETLEAQKKALETNPLMQKFRESRKEMADDPYRPNYHFVNPLGNLNDPNGLSYWNGRWHLFYQAYPPEDPRQHWGHAVSKDLIHWKDLPYAIYPGPEHACYSGATLVEEDRVIAMYHGTRVGNMVATADDPLLLNWEKVTGEAVIPLENITNPNQPYDVFDPNIWKKDGMYYSLSAGRKPEGPDGKQVRAHYLFRSKNLKNWEYVHEFVENDRFTKIGDDGACPYFWPIGDRYILPFFSHMSGGQYLLGDYKKEKDKFYASAHGMFNFRSDGNAGVHAPSATPAPNGNGVIIIFNMEPGKPTEGWNQIMSLPRLLTLRSKNKISMQPAGNIESLRYDHQQLSNTTLPANKEIVLDDIEGDAMQIKATIDPQNAEMFEMNVLRSPDKEEYTRIVFYKEKGFPGEDYLYESRRQKASDKSLISIDASHSSVLSDVQPIPPETAPVQIKEGESIELNVFIDKSIVEVFVNNKQAVAVRVYPGKENSRGVSFRSQGKESEIVSLDSWKMKSIYDNE